MLPGGARALDHGQPVNIGVLTIAWGTTPATETLRESLTELGYRENVDFAIGIRFTEGRSQDLYQGALDLKRDIEEGKDNMRKRTTFLIISILGVAVLGLPMALGSPGASSIASNDAHTIKLGGRIFQMNPPSLIMDNRSTLVF